MGRVRTAAAKKFHEKEVSSDDESLANVKRAGRPKKASKLNATSNGHPSSRQSAGRSTRTTRNSISTEKENRKNGPSNNKPSDSSSEDESPIVSPKRKASTENASAKKQRPSTSASASKKTKTDKDSTPAKPSKKKKKPEEEQYEVEKILDHKFEDNVKFFLIRWKGYDSSVDSWERRHNISCPGLLAKYYEEHPEASVAAKNSNKKRKKKKIIIQRNLKIDEQIDYDDDWDEDEDYEVERILDVYIQRNNKREFLIRWKGYSSKSDSWEPEENLDCKELIEKFMEKIEGMKNISQKDLRPVRSQTQRFTLMTQASERRLSKRNLGRQRAVYHDCDE